MTKWIMTNACFIIKYDSAEGTDIPPISYFELLSLLVSLPQTVAAPFGLWDVVAATWVSSRTTW